jgi:hypothetical protein
VEAAGLHRPHPGLHVGHDLVLHVPDDQGEGQEHDQDGQHLDRHQHPVVVEQVADGVDHRSMSPTMKNIEPITAIMSGTRVPFRRYGSEEMLLNDGVRILNRQGVFSPWETM